MYKYLLLILILCGCQTHKSMISNESEKIEKSNTNCPENGTCNLEVINNTSVILSRDEFGKSYIKTKNSKSTLIKYSYAKKKDVDIADDGYSEIIYLELKNGVENLQKKGNALSDVNAIFGRFCFCGDKTGYYKITHGELIIKKGNGGDFILTFNFKILETPQLIFEINERLLL